MASKSARKYITGPKEITVKQFKQVTKDLAVLSYMEGDVRFDDIYNVNDRKMMNILALVAAKHVVTAMVGPDVSTDQDSCPEVLSATLVQ